MEKEKTKHMKRNEVTGFRMCTFFSVLKILEYDTKRLLQIKCYMDFVFFLFCVLTNCVYFRVSWEQLRFVLVILSFIVKNEFQVSKK